ncbi:response regulator [Pseudidiomarina sp. CB1]|uniref:response regulator n=1 Tax=Pseudidiomarina sp. CB1 TaxID=2972484 RepID=UPI0021619B1F|nr:response regulator [Pseudidiomarina sp. CB1]
MRLLLIEDDRLIAEGIVSGLKKLGYHVEHCTTQNQATSALSTDTFQLLILDLGLPDGLAIPFIAKVKSAGLDAPILVLTAWDDVDKKVAALDAGADDYMVKPFDLRELEARIRVLVRRHQGRQSDELQWRNLTIDLATQDVRVDDEVVTLTRREWLLLKEFMLNPKRILSREHLESVLYGWDSEVESNAIEVHLHHLRKKLGRTLLRNVRGVGYILNQDYQGKEA